MHAYSISPKNLVMLTYSAFTGHGLKNTDIKKSSPCNLQYNSTGIIVTIITHRLRKQKMPAQTVSMTPDMRWATKSASEKRKKTSTGIKGIKISELEDHVDVYVWTGGVCEAKCPA